MKFLTVMTTMLVLAFGWGHRAVRAFVTKTTTTRRNLVAPFERSFFTNSMKASTTTTDASSAASTDEESSSPSQQQQQQQALPDMDEIVSLCKRRGIIFPSSEIYNGYAGFFDYGPLGCELKKNLKDLWWKTFVTQREDVVGLDSSIIHNPVTWKSSGMFQNKIK